MFDAGDQGVVLVGGRVVEEAGPLGRPAAHAGTRPPGAEVGVGGGREVLVQGGTQVTLPPLETGKYFRHKMKIL